MAMAPRACARPHWRILAALLLSLTLLPALQTAWAAPAVQNLQHAEAVRAGWNSAEPPATGWMPVTLPDTWTTRWPDYSGVVWYRLNWQQSSTQQATALWLDRVSMADAIYINGSLIYRAPHLREPLSREQVHPQYFLLPQPLLHSGQNTVLVRVSGLAAYAPGLGAVATGDPASLHARWERGMWLRVDMRIFDLTTDIVLGTLFGLLWLLRRRETLYGWFALASFSGALYGLNFVATSPWPFSGSNAWMALHAASHIVTAVSLTLFLLRYAELRWPRSERALLAGGALLVLLALVWPNWVGPHHLWLRAPAAALMYLSIGYFVYYALHTRRVALVVPALFLLLPVAAAIHDTLAQTGVIDSTTYLSDLTSPVSLVGISFVLAYRFVQAMRRVEHFNAELAHKVDGATDRLRAMLRGEQDLALDNARMGERLDLVRDLHDGFGGSLLGAIATLQAQPDTPEREATIETLRALREDLRLVVDTTVNADDRDLDTLLADLRHRTSQRLELAGIAAHWNLQGLAGLRPGPARSLDVLRLLQEALTNVIKHSAANNVWATLARTPEGLQIEVRDDGRGFAIEAAVHVGAGLASLQARARRLGCALHVDSAPGRGTRIGCMLPLTAAGAAAATMPAPPAAPARG